MISFELATKLKDAGFPQNGVMGDWVYVWEDEDPVLLEDSERQNENMIFIPSLEELIEACGISFVALVNDFNGQVEAVIRVNIDSNKIWHCWSNQPKRGDSFGATPEVAVANLYLFLHTK